MTKWNAESAEWYAAKYGDYPTNRLGIDALRLEPGLTIVDIGCGTGTAIRHAASKVEGVFIGVDPVDRMLEIARTQTEGHTAQPRIEFRRGSASALPIEDDSADLVLAFDSFDHWADRAAGLQEVARVLAPQGRFAVVKDGAVPASESSASGFEEMARSAGFALVRTDRLEEDDVVATLWVFEIPHA